MKYLQKSPIILQNYQNRQPTYCSDSSITLLPYKPVNIYFYSIFSTQKPESVLIIGAGVMGLTTALHLVERGYKVTVLEKADNVAMVR